MVHKGRLALYNGDRIFLGTLDRICKTVVKTLAGNPIVVAETYGGEIVSLESTGYIVLPLPG